MKLVAFLGCHGYEYLGEPAGAFRDRDDRNSHVLDPASEFISKNRSLSASLLSDKGKRGLPVANEFLYRTSYALEGTFMNFGCCVALFERHSSTVVCPGVPHTHLSSWCFQDTSTATGRRYI